MRSGQIPSNFLQFVSRKHGLEFTVISLHLVLVSLGFTAAELEASASVSVPLNGSKKQ